MSVLMEETKWVIMDKENGLIGKGTPRNRRLRLVDEGKSRILTYSSQGRAKAAYRDYGFFMSEKAKKYAQEVYGVDRHEFSKNRTKYLKAVRVTVRMIR